MVSVGTDLSPKVEVQFEGHSLLYLPLETGGGCRRRKGGWLVLAPLPSMYPSLNPFLSIHVHLSLHISPLRLSLQ